MMARVLHIGGRQVSMSEAEDWVGDYLKPTRTD